MSFVVLGSKVSRTFRIYSQSIAIHQPDGCLRNLASILQPIQLQTSFLNHPLSTSCCGEIENMCATLPCDQCQAVLGASDRDVRQPMKVKGPHARGF